jgi:hypothetical protein
MARKSSYTAEQIISALHEADGYVSKAASILGCSAATMYNYRIRYSTVAEAWNDIHEKRHDFVENALHKLIKSGNPAAIIFYLKTQAKGRGYVERQEITGADGGPVSITQIEIVKPEGWDDE